MKGTMIYWYLVKSFLKYANLIFNIETLMASKTY